MNKRAALATASAPRASLPELPRYPALFEINTRVWLDRLSRVAGRLITLAEVDDASLDELARLGFDWIWLLGVWQTGAASRAVSRANSAWRAEFRAALPDLTEEDIAGSGFAISAYEVDQALGGRQALAELRRRLARRGLRLMLDFVPNHTALDHPWVKADPDFYVQGSEEALAAAPENWRRVETDRGDRILAHGRDPNFAGWKDTLQLNYANAALQAAQMGELAAAAEQCDGLRCDMAMLQLPEVFQRSWGLTPPPFWPAAIATVRRAHPGFTFLAEAYWDLEWELQQQGFDYCYDKRLYDRLRAGDAAAIRAHLDASLAYQDRLARFLENHDEARAAAIWPWPRHRAAAVLAYLAPGLRLFHQGQFEGARVHVPVHLRRGPVEPADPEIALFYGKLLAVLRQGTAFRDGGWSLVPPVPAWIGNRTSENVVAYAWLAPGSRDHIVVVNVSDHRAQCYLRLRSPALHGNRFRLTDEMGREVYERDGDGLAEPGLYIDLGAWCYNVFRLDRLAAGGGSAGPRSADDRPPAFRGRVRSSAGPDGRRARAEDERPAPPGRQGRRERARQKRGVEGLAQPWRPY